MNEFNYLYNKAMSILNLRDHSQKSLIKKLQKHCENPETISLVMQRLIELNYVCEERFTEIYIKSYQRKYGNSRIKYNLQQEGIKQETIEKYLSNDVNSQLEQCLNVWQKKFKELPTTQLEFAKHYRFLGYRGFSNDVIMRILKGWGKNENN